MIQSTEPAKSHAKRRLAVVVAGGIAEIAVGLGGIYGIGMVLGNRAVEPACQPAAETAKQIAPLARGEVAAVGAATRPIVVPDLTFQDAQGNARKLSDWRGRTVLLNLWATWCLPCRQEMPALDALQSTLGNAKFEVVAINIDTRDPDKPKTWLEETGVGKLAYYADSTAKVFQDLKQIGKAFGMPTTILIDGAGCEVATLAGPAEWASEDALKLIRAALAETRT